MELLVKISHQNGSNFDFDLLQEKVADPCHKFYVFGFYLICLNLIEYFVVFC